jgi:hypothetical protein
MTTALPATRPLHLPCLSCNGFQITAESSFFGPVGTSGFAEQRTAYPKFDMQYYMALQMIG